MAASSKTTTGNSDIAFNKQIDTVREALKNFAAIAQLNAPGPAKLALEELIKTSVRRIFVRPKTFVLDSYRLL